MPKQSRQRIIENKESQLHKVHEKIYSLSGAAAEKSAQLKKEKEDHTSSRLSMARHKMHVDSTINDRILRPSDRGNDIRTYSKMDLDIWHYDDVRKWFNSYSASDSPPDSSCRLNMHETGYMVRK